MNKEIKHIIKQFPDRKNPFQTPEGYFQSFPDRVLGRIEEEKTITSKQMFLRYLRPVLAMAASFTIIFFLIYVPVKTFGPSLAKSKTEIVEDDFLTQYLTDEVIYKSLANEDEELFDETTIETVLIASVSVIELLDIKNETP